MPILNCLTYASKEGGAADDYSSWFGTGEDGDLTVSSDVALPVALDSGQIIKQYNNLTVTSTGVLHPANRCNGMILLVKGDLTVDGTIHVDKCAPLLNDNEELAAQEQHIVLCGVTAGGKGGDGGSAFGSAPSFATSAAGSGGHGFPFGGGFGGGGGADGYSQYGVWNAGSGDPRPPAGSTIPYPANPSSASLYGAGGSGGSNAGSSYALGGGGPGGGGANARGNLAGGAGDAIGGGALWIFAQGQVRIGSTARIGSNGGNGGTSSGRYDGSTVYHYPGSGGGGGGGIVCIVHTGDIVNQGNVSALGGTSPMPSNTNGTTGTSAKGQDGSSGTVLITNIADLLGEGEWEPEWVTCSFDYSSPGKPSKLALVVNVDGVPTAINYASGNMPARYTTLQVLKGSIFAFDGIATFTTGETVPLFDDGMSMYVMHANGDFTITG